jgi:hypothetical protein
MAKASLVTGQEPSELGRFHFGDATSLENCHHDDSHLLCPEIGPRIIVELGFYRTSILFSGWDSSYAGIYMACLGLLMLPANLSLTWSDNTTIENSWSDVVMLVGLSSSREITWHLQAQYYDWICCHLCRYQRIGRPTMIFCQRPFPNRGVANVGFLATEAGTFDEPWRRLIDSIWANGLQKFQQYLWRHGSLLSSRWVLRF